MDGAARAGELGAFPVLDAFEVGTLVGRSVKATRPATTSAPPQKISQFRMLTTSLAPPPRRGAGAARPRARISLGEVAGGSLSPQGGDLVLESREHRRVRFARV
jgi:hypothetical protein